MSERNLSRIGAGLLLAGAVALAVQILVSLASIPNADIFVPFLLVVSGPQLVAGLWVLLPWGHEARRPIPAPDPHKRLCLVVEHLAPRPGEQRGTVATPGGLDWWVARDPSGGAAHCRGHPGRGVVGRSQVAHGHRRFGFAGVGRLPTPTSAIAGPEGSNRRDDFSPSAALARRPAVRKLRPEGDRDRGLAGLPRHICAGAEVGWRPRRRPNLLG